MKRFTMTMGLVCILSVSALAGNIPCDLVPPPPPPDPPKMTSTISPWDIPTGGLTGETPTGSFTQQAEDAMLGGVLTVIGWIT